MKEENQMTSPMGIGIITIFTVLLVLTLSIFAALTLSSARADLALSQINADTVSAYYSADAQAARLWADFSAGQAAELEQDIPMTDNQHLHIRFFRDETGAPVIGAWTTVTDEPAEEEIADTPQLFQGFQEGEDTP